MSALRLQITMSLDGCVAGPNQSVENPLGEGGRRIHEWAFGLKTFRVMHGDGAGGEHGQCGWLKDRFGLSWQVVPSVVPALVSDPDTAKAKRVIEAIMKMRKLDITELERAHAGR